VQDWLIRRRNCVAVQTLQSRGGHLSRKVKVQWRITIDSPILMRHQLMELQNHWGEPSTKWTMFVHFAFYG